MTLNPSIPLLSPDQKSSPTRFSKWMSIDVLLGYEEMQTMLQQLPGTYFIAPYNPDPKTPCLVRVESFLEAYQNYIQALTNQKLPNYSEIKKYFNLMLVPSLDGLYLKSIGKDKHALLFQAPYIEIKPIGLTISNVDDSIRAQPLTDTNIAWGLRFSCPQIAQDPHSHSVTSILPKDHSVGQLFKTIRTWLRSHSRTTPLVIHFKKVNHTVRLGKSCFHWINKHPQLIQYPIKVEL